MFRIIYLAKEYIYPNKKNDSDGILEKKFSGSIFEITWERKCNNVNTRLLIKAKYLKPQLKVIGKISSLTLKTGSISDFGGNKYTP